MSCPGRGCGASSFKPILQRRLDKDGDMHDYVVIECQECGAHMGQEAYLIDLLDEAIGKPS